MTKLETVERDLQRDVDREVRDIQIAARKLAKKFEQIAGEDTWLADLYDLPRDTGTLLQKIGHVNALRDALQGISWAQDRPQCGGCGN